MKETILQKLDKLVVGQSELKVRFDNFEAKFDSVEKEMQRFRGDSTRNTERIIRLEETDKNLHKEYERTETRVQSALDRIENRFSEKMEAIQQTANERVDKKLANLKLALFSSLAAVALTVARLAMDIFSR
jgi:predicted nuclease with TOPRIM domain